MTNEAMTAGRTGGMTMQTPEDLVEWTPEQQSKAIAGARDLLAANIAQQPDADPVSVPGWMQYCVALLDAERRVHQLTRVNEEGRLAYQELLAKFAARETPDTVRELITEIGRLQSRLAYKVLGDPTQSVGQRASAPAGKAAGERG